MVVVRRRLRTSGLSEGSITLIRDAHRASTRVVYDAHWKRWSDWCADKGVDPVAPSAVDLANHLTFLANELGLSVSSLRVRRSAVCRTLRMLGVSGLSVSPYVTDVLKGVAQRQARTPVRVPAWDLSLVLEFLRSSRFEPLASAPLRLVIVKTAFLVLLASGRRASEVNGLSGRSSDIAFESDGSISLRFLPEFRAKNQRPGDVSPVLVIRPLSDLVSLDDPDCWNCPVRALRFYLKRSKRLRSLKQRQLFISLNFDYHKDIRSCTLSRWVSRLISDAYKSVANKSGGGVEWLPLSCPRTHETRAWAASLAALRSRSIRELLDAAYWRSATVFTSHYLRDVARRRDDGSWGLPSLVAAGTVVSSSL
jgi:hypothetical protein